MVFRFATSLVHKILTGGSAPGLVESFSQLPPLLRLGIPALGGLLAGAIIQFGTRLRGEVTTTDYMEAVVLGDGKIAARRTLLKCLSALFTIASGGSIGREGPLVQLSSLVASLTGRLRKWSTPRLRLLAGCGADSCADHGYHHDFRDHARLSDHSPVNARMRSCVLHFDQHRETLNLR
jgi:chloride channel protein, CIC family